MKKTFPVEHPRRLVYSLGDFFEILRRLPPLRATIFGAKPRRFYAESPNMDICLGWSRITFVRHIPVDMNALARRGLLHITFCGHESARPTLLALNGFKGFTYWRGSYTARLNLAAFCFVLSIEWCHTINFERLDGPHQIR